MNISLAAPLKRRFDTFLVLLGFALFLPEDGVLRCFLRPVGHRDRPQLEGGYLVGLLKEAIMPAPCCFGVDDARVIFVIMSPIMFLAALFK